MNKSDYYAEIGLKAAKRAAQKVREQACKEGRAIPIWKNGRVEYEIPSMPEKPLQENDKVPTEENVTNQND